MDQQRASQGPDGSYNLDGSLCFTYQALSKELHVGDVYLRVYNNQPDSELSEPEVFCLALVEFISGVVDSLSAQDSDVHSGTVKNAEEETSRGDEDLVMNLEVSLISLQVGN